MDNTDYDQREAETLSRMPLQPSRIPRGEDVTEEQLEAALFLDEGDLNNVLRPKEWTIE